MRNLFFITTIALILVSSENSYSENPYCLDFPDVECVRHGLHIETPCNTNPGSPYCVIDVHFCIRVVHEGVNTYRDTYIYDYTASNECSCMDVETRIMKSIWSFYGPMSEEDGGFGIPYSGWWEGFRVIESLCWKYIALQNKFQLQFCNDTACCRQEYRVRFGYSCQDTTTCSLRANEVQRTLNFEPIVDCDTGSGCWSRCTEWIIPSGDLPPDLGTISQSAEKRAIISEDLAYSSNCVVIVKPNPTFDNAEFIISSTINGEGILKVIDNKGDIVYLQQFTKDDKEFSVAMKISKLNSGFYYYVITLNNDISLYGKFLIIK